MLSLFESIFYQVKLGLKIRKEIHLDDQGNDRYPFIYNRRREITQRHSRHIVWKGSTDVGLIKGIEPVKISPKYFDRPHQRQYPVKMKQRKV